MHWDTPKRKTKLMLSRLVRRLSYRKQRTRCQLKNLDYGKFYQL